MIQLALAITVFVASCVGLGFLAEWWACKRKWPWWVSLIFLVVISVIWPVVILGAAIYSAIEFGRQHPNEVNDGPALVLYGLFTFYAPLLFVISMGLAAVGMLLVTKKNTSTQDSDAGA